MHDLRRLRAFLAVAAHGSFSEAAAEEGYAQSVVSHHVAALERELGVVLVDRGSRPVGLTEAGERMREHAEAILGRVDAAERELRAIAGLQAGTLRMSAFLAASISFVPRVVREFRAAHPAIDLQLAQQSTDDAIAGLRAGSLDLAVIWLPEGVALAPADGLTSETLGEEPYRIALPTQHRAARKQRVRLEDLAGEPFTYPRPSREGSRYLTWLRARCAEAGFEPDLRYPVDDVMVGRAFVASGLCVGVLPHLALSGTGDDIAVRPLPGHRGFRSIIAVSREGRGTPAVEPMLRVLRRAVRTELAASG